jgi:DNA-binding response OmpR family regulator
MGNSKHIILVDDDPAILDAIRIMMERKCYRLTTFGDGRPLLSGAFEKADLFILDKQLPGVDGLDICRYLKAQEATKEIPILILSASHHVAALAKAACANSFLEKPFKMQHLREIIEQLLSV